ncbi:glycogen/starch synthase, partial [bacterium]|nr:glycogen/starch synthase [bacterium]
PLFLRKRPEFQTDPFLSSTRVLYSIHNLGYPGRFGKGVIPFLGLPPEEDNMERLEFWGGISFMKSGLLYAHRTSTVSQTYAREILTRDYGCGLEGYMLRLGRHPVGILNGVDYSQWDPRRDPHIAKNYWTDSLEAKQICKADLLKTLRWTEDTEIPLIGMVARLDPQKGIDLVIEALPEILGKTKARFVILGDGNPHYEQMLQELQRRFPRQMRSRLVFDIDLAHAIEAGSDAFLMPSRYEPCGLNQMFSLRYGTVPIVRRTGGLADTVWEGDPRRMPNTHGTGFVFQEYSIPALVGKVVEAIDVYRKQPRVWQRLMENGMAQDFSWQRSAKEYERLYDEMIST